MAVPVAPGNQGTSTRPYLIRALHDWCSDNGFTPYIAVFVDASVRVPTEYVKNGEIVLNVGFEATSGLKLGNEVIEFKARFGGSAREIIVPVSHVIAVYARENGQGMAFPAPSGARASAEADNNGNSPSQRDQPTARGLRLASAEETVGHTATGPVAPADPPPDAEPPGAGGSRPPLKRVK
jgi:stringent starvation protein B